MLVLISALTLLAAQPATAAPVAPVEISPPRRTSIPIGQIGVKDPDRLTCKRESVVGSRRKTKICDSALGWQKRQDAAQEAMDVGDRTTGGSKPR